jgi:glutaredoxin
MSTAAAFWPFGYALARFDKALGMLRPVALVLALVGSGSAAAAQAPAPLDEASAEALVVFVRDGCPYCAEAKLFLEDVARQRPSLGIVYRYVDRDPAAAEDLARIFRDANVWPPGVPTFVAGGRVFVGFESAKRSGPEVLALIGGAAPAPRTEVETAFGTLSASRLGLPLFTIALGLLDGFNPCAMWVLLFLLSLLVRLQDRKRMAIIAGAFVIVSGLVYYAFMAAWLNVFQAVGLTATVRWVLGGVAIVIGAFNVKDFFAFGRGPSFSIPSSAKPGLYARVRAVLDADVLATSLMAVAALAVAVNLIELLCTAGLPAIYTAVLTQHALEPAAYYAYLGLYIVGYIFDDSVMVATAVFALNRRKLTERAGRWLKLLSGAVMLLLGIVLIARPDWLR